MKKLFISVVALCMIFSLSACENDEKESSAKPKQEVNSGSDTGADSSGVSSGGTKVQLTDLTGPFEAKQEIIDAAWDSGLVQIDDKLIQLPLYLDEWVDLGLDYEVDAGYGKDSSKDYLFAQNDKVTLKLMYKGDNIGIMTFRKETETPETVKDMNPLIEEISIRPIIGKPENITVYFPGGLEVGDPYTSIEQKLGKATEIDQYMNYKYGQIGSVSSDLYYGMNVSVDKNNQVISGIAIGKSVSECDREDLTTISFENVPNMQTTEVHNVSLLWASEYKQIPGMLKNERNVDSVLNVNGKKYYMSLSFHILASKYVSEYAYISYGDPILDVTDENGVNRKVYVTDYAYEVVCSTDVHVFEASISCTDLSDPSENALAALQDLVVDIANSVQF